MSSSHSRQAHPHYILFPPLCHMQGVSLDLDLSVQVLTTGSWPQATAAAPCTLPRELQQATEAFRAFYLEAHSGAVKTCTKCWACPCTAPSLPTLPPARRVSP